MELWTVWGKDCKVNMKSVHGAGQDRVMNEETRSQSCKEECVERYVHGRTINTTKPVAQTATKHMRQMPVAHVG